MELTEDQRRDTVTLADLHARVAALTEQINDIKTRLRTELAPGAYTINGEPAVTVTPQRRFDPAVAERVLPPDFLELCRVPKVDASTARKVLPPALYAACQADSGEPVIRLA